MRGKKHPLDEQGRSPWEAEGLAYSTWNERRKGVRPKAEYMAELHRARELVDRRVKSVEQSVGGVRRSWIVAITDTFGGSWSTISKKREEIAEATGIPLPLRFEFERGSDAEKAFLRAYALSCLSEERRPNADDPVTGLSPASQAKLEAFKQAFVRQQEREYAMRVHDAAVKMVDDVFFDRFREREREAKQYEAAWKGIYAKADYQLLLKCLHPDGNCSDEQYNRAFALIREKEQVLLKAEVRKPLGWETMPKNLEELLARRRR